MELGYRVDCIRRAYGIICLSCTLRPPGFRGGSSSGASRECLADPRCVESVASRDLEFQLRHAQFHVSAYG